MRDFASGVARIASTSGGSSVASAGCGVGRDRDAEPADRRLVDVLLDERRRAAACRLRRRPVPASTKTAGAAGRCRGPIDQPVSAAPSSARCAERPSPAKLCDAFVGLTGCNSPRDTGPAFSSNSLSMKSPRHEQRRPAGAVLREALVRQDFERIAGDRRRSSVGMSSVVDVVVRPVAARRGPSRPAARRSSHGCGEVIFAGRTTVHRPAFAAARSLPRRRASRRGASRGARRRSRRRRRRRLAACPAETRNLPSVWFAYVLLERDRQRRPPSPASGSARWNVAVRFLFRLPGRRRSPSRSSGCRRSRSATSKSVCEKSASRARELDRLGACAVRRSVGRDLELASATKLPLPRPCRPGPSAGATGRSALRGGTRSTSSRSARRPGTCTRPSPARRRRRAPTPSSRRASVAPLVATAARRLQRRPRRSLSSPAGNSLVQARFERRDLRLDLRALRVDRRRRGSRTPARPRCSGTRTAGSTPCA